MSSVCVIFSWYSSLPCYIVLLCSPIYPCHLLGIDKGKLNPRPRWRLPPIATATLVSLHIGILVLGASICVVIVTITNFLPLAMATQHNLHQCLHGLVSAQMGKIHPQKSPVDVVGPPSDRQCPNSMDHGRVDQVQPPLRCIVIIIIIIAAVTVTAARCQKSDAVSGPCPTRQGAPGQPQGGLGRDARRVVFARCHIPIQAYVILGSLLGGQCATMGRQSLAVRPPPRR